ncbi:MAG TPA: RNA polymerase sigma factor [Ohtaekwangia sp.]|nr:RNA polymerase sigma factor [Ohtaekwangia sp.]
MVDQKLFERCRRNESSAQRALYDLFKAKLMGLCRRYARDRDDAQDMLQEAFIKIFSRLHQVESAAKLESWMKVIAVRTAIDHYHLKKQSKIFIVPPVPYDVAGKGYEIIIDGFSDEYLVKLINDLPEGCRMVFNLSVVEGYDHEEIGNMLGISTSTSRSQLHYAKQLLIGKLNRLGITHYEKFA